MHGFTELLLAMPSWVLAVVAGAVGGAIGTLIGQLIRRRSASSKAIPMSVAICTVLAFQGAMTGGETFHKSVALEQTIDALKTNRLFAVIIRLHPDVEQRLRAELQPILSGQSADQAFVESQTVTARIVGEYYPPYMPRASDEALYRVIQRSADVLTSFKSKPDLCVAYHLGVPQFKKDDVSAEFAEIDTGLKADLIESAVANHDPQKTPATMEAIVATLTDAYARNGYPVDNLYKVADVATIPSAEGCQVALQYVSAIASLGQDKAAYIFKSLLAHDK